MLVLYSMAYAPMIPMSPSPSELAVKVVDVSTKMERLTDNLAVSSSSRFGYMWKGIEQATRALMRPQQYY